MDSYKEERIEGSNIIKTTFKIGSPEEEITVEKFRKKGIKECQKCKKEFKSTSNNQLYCKDCKNNNWKEYMRERMSEDRLMARLSEYTDIQINKFNEIMLQQQFAEDVPNNELSCYICDSKINVLEHHISYVPEIKIPFCKKCHGFYHNMLLKRRKCKPY